MILFINNHKIVSLIYEIHNIYSRCIKQKENQNNGIEPCNYMSRLWSKNTYIFGFTFFILTPIIGVWDLITHNSIRLLVKPSCGEYVKKNFFQLFYLGKLLKVHLPKSDKNKINKKYRRVWLKILLKTIIVLIWSNKTVLPITNQL